jgi:hypothetical protein
MQSCEFNICDGNVKVRFSLGQDGNRRLFVLGLNPSTADTEKSDQTIRKVKGFVKKQNKFDGFVMLNLCPLRSTNPNALPKLEDDELICLAKYNCKAIQGILEQENAPTVWAAWGNNIEKRPYLFEYLQTIVKTALNRKADWKMCGEMTKLGHPRHPTRLGYEIEFRRFDVKAYLCAFAPLR